MGVHSPLAAHRAKVPCRQPDRPGGNRGLPWDPPFAMVGSGNVKEVDHADRSGCWCSAGPTLRGDRRCRAPAVDLGSGHNGRVRRADTPSGLEQPSGPWRTQRRLGADDHVHDPVSPPAQRRLVERGAATDPGRPPPACSVCTVNRLPLARALASPVTGAGHVIIRRCAAEAPPGRGCGCAGPCGCGRLARGCEGRGSPSGGRHPPSRRARSG